MSNTSTNSHSKSTYSSQLQDHSLHLSQIRVHSDQSLVIFLESFAIKIKKFFRDKHLDINIPRLIVFLAFLVPIYFMVMDTNKENGTYEKAKDIGSLVGVGMGILFAMTNLHNQYHYNKRTKSSQYIEKWHSNHFFKLRKTVRKIIEEEFYSLYPIEFNSKIFNQCHSELIELKKSTDGIQILQQTQSKILYRLTLDKHKDERENIDTLLNFFEYMGQDVKLQVADADYLKDYFYTIIINYYEFFRKYLEYEQFESSSRVMYCNFVYLAQTWEKEGALPLLPKICKRPFILTSDDINQVQDIQEKSKFFSLKRHSGS